MIDQDDFYVAFVKKKYFSILSPNWINIGRRTLKGAILLNKIFFFLVLITIFFFHKRNVKIIMVNHNYVIMFFQSYK